MTGSKLRLLQRMDAPAEECVALCCWRRHKARLSAKGHASAAGACIPAFVMESKNKCSIHGESKCGCVRKLFQSTKNSKRNLFVFMFLQHRLGAEFPITDHMVTALMPLLEATCGNGVEYVISSSFLDACF
jgi:hypothetical protein